MQANVNGAGWAPRRAHPDGVRAVAGAGEGGIAALRWLLLERGGAPQATLPVFGARLLAAVLVP